MCSFAGCHDPRHANLQSHDAIWLRPDTPACTEHQQYIYTGGTAEATTTAATATTGTAGKRRYNTEYWHFLPHPFPALRGEIKISSPQISCLLHIFWENKFNFSSISELYWKFIIEKNNFLCSSGLPGTSGQTPQLFHSQTVTGSTTTALPGNTPLYNTPLTPMTPITPATPASESSGIVPQLQYVEKMVRVSIYTTCILYFLKLLAYSHTGSVVNC